MNYRWKNTATSEDVNPNESIEGRSKILFCCNKSSLSMNFLSTHCIAKLSRLIVFERKKVYKQYWNVRTRKFFEAMWNRDIPVVFFHDSRNYFIVSSSKRKYRIWSSSISSILTLLPTLIFQNCSVLFPLAKSPFWKLTFYSYCIDACFETVRTWKAIFSNLINCLFYGSRKKIVWQNFFQGSQKKK